MTDQTFKKLPAVLATQRTYTLSDGIFYNVNEAGDRTPVKVTRHGIRATNNTPPKSKSDGTLEEKDVRNLQIVDSAKLDFDAVEFEVEFQLSFLDLGMTLSSISGDDSAAVRQSVDSFVERAKGSEGLIEVSRRYARNLLNGRWLWRNRLIAEAVSVSVTKGDERVCVSDALSLPLSNFDNYSPAEINLANTISSGLRGQMARGMTITAAIKPKAPGAVEVFPSQNYLDGPKDGRPSRSLYVLNRPVRIDTTQGPAFVGTAALRDQKIANALRTIDTWYQSDIESPYPIAIEQYGANLDAQKFFRVKGNQDAYHFMKSLNVLDPNTDDGMFMIACLIRGAVYAGG